MSSYDFSSSNPKIWSSAKTLRDIFEAYQGICEKKEYSPSRDQDGDGDNDFADNMIARMVASGMSREEAIRKVKNKEYNKEEVELVDELYKGKHGQTETEYQDSRSNAGKMVSGTSTLSGAAYSSRGVKNSGPNPAGGSKRPKGQGRMTRGQRTEMQYRKAILNKEEKQLNREAYEAYEIVASYLLENNFASTVEDANVIIENMSEKWFNQIMKG